MQPYRTKSCDIATFRARYLTSLFFFKISNNNGQKPSGYTTDNKDQIMATSATDISYYLGDNELENIGNLDVPLSNGEIVSINLIDELPDDCNEIINLLETENCPVKYWVSIARAYVEKNQLTDALLVIEKSESLKTDKQDVTLLQNFKSWLYLKFITTGVNRLENINSLSQVIAQMSSSSSGDSVQKLNSLSLQAVYALVSNRDEEALKYFEQLLTANELNCFALLGKAQIILKRSSNYATALKLFQQVLIINPLMKPDPRIGIGLCFWFLKDYKMAVKSWERCLQLDPDNFKAKILLNLSNFNNTFNNSLTDEDFLKNYESCLNNLKDLHTKNNNDPVVLLTLSSYFFSKKNYDLVEKIINKIIGSINIEKTGVGMGLGKLSKFQANLLSQCSFWLGRCYFNKSDFNQSQRYFHESNKFDDTNVLSKIGLGQSQVCKHLQQEALITFENLIKEYPKNLEINYCLGLLYSQLKSKRRKDMAINILERYISLSNNRGLTSDSDDLLLNKEPINLNAYIILSKLYESKDINQSLSYLTKAVESRQQINHKIPSEIFNNIGVFNFNKNNYEVASKNFELAIESLNETPEIFDTSAKREDIMITLNYNLGRSLEVTDQTKSISLHQEILNNNPNYFSAKLRILFLNLVSINEMSNEDVKKELEDLLTIQASNLELRAFYGWFVKTFGKRVGLKPDLDTNHQKETLVKFNSHDCYALISLANIYCIMARDLKGDKNEERRKKYYIRAIELFLKVLSTDSKNVYAAQGLAIIYIENKEYTKGLDILRKIRDSLNDISIYLNLGHVLNELKNYSKAIESYEIALNKFTNGNDCNILSFLAKSWLLRGHFEKNLAFLSKAKEITNRAIEYSTDHSKQSNSLKFNLSYIQYQIADLLIKLSVTERKIEDIEQGINDLNAGIGLLNDLVEHEEDRVLPYSKKDLKLRADLGSTLLNRLTNVKEETQAYNQGIENKLEAAKKIRQEEMNEKLKIEQEQQLKQQLIEEERAKERAKLQEQAQQWAEEARIMVDEENDDKLFNDETEKDKQKGEKKGKRKNGGKGKKGKKAGKKNGSVDDSESNTEGSEPEPEPELEDDNEESSSEPENNENNDDEDAPIDKGKKKNTKKRKKEIEDKDDEDEDEEVVARKKKYKSSDVINDSDEGLDDDLF